MLDNSGHNLEHSALNTLKNTAVNHSTIQELIRQYSPLQYTAARRDKTCPHSAYNPLIKLPMSLFLYYNSLNYIRLHYTTMNYNTIHFTTINYSRLSYTQLHYNNYTIAQHTTIHLTTQTKLQYNKEIKTIIQ